MNETGTGVEKGQTGPSRQADPLGRVDGLECRQCFPVLGVPLEIATNSARVHAMAQSTFGSWKEIDPSLVETRAPASAQIVVREYPASDALPDAFLYGFHDECLLSTGRGVQMSIDRKAGRALAFVTPEAASRGRWFRREVLECMALFVVSYVDRTPLHAACVTRGARAVLLIGASGTGKSTLAYGLCRAGYSLMSEDVPVASLERGLRLWGHPTGITLCPDAKRHFPELVSLEPCIQPNGKLKLNVDLNGPRPTICPAYTFSGNLFLFFLEHNPERGRALEGMSAKQARDRLSEPREPGFDLGVDQSVLIAELIKHPSFVLTTNLDPNLGVDCIRSTVE